MRGQIPGRRRLNFSRNSVEAEYEEAPNPFMPSIVAHAHTIELVSLNFFVRRYLKEIGILEQADLRPHRAI